MKWTCEKCGAINPQFSYRCHSCKHDLDASTKRAPDHVEIRGTGKSTVIALRLIADAIERPGKWFEVKDHEGSRRATEHLMNQIWDIIRNNQFDIELDSQRFRIKSLHTGFRVVNGIMQGKVKSDV